MRARRRLVKSGNVMVNCELAPYGYRLSEDRKSFVVYEPEAQIVRSVFNWYIYGDEQGRHLGYKAIATRLTQMQIPSCMDRGTKRWKQRPKGEWAPTSVGYILRNETYAGRWYYGRKGPNGINPKDHWIAVDVPPIVTRELWEMAQAQRPKNKDAAKRNTKREYLMQGRLRCGRCDSGMSPKVWSGHGREYRNYRCAARLGYVVAKECDLPSFRVEAVDEAIWNWVCSLLNDPGTLAESLEAYQQQRRSAQAQQYERLEVIAGILEQQRTQLTRLLDLNIAGEFPKEILAERKSHLEKSIQDLEAERRSLTGRLNASSLTGDRIKMIEAFANNVSKRLEHAYDDFASRRNIIEELEVRATLEVQDGLPICSAECILGEEVLSIAHSSSPTTDWPVCKTGRWCSGLSASGATARW
jgi:site-specific DNA recombinase